MPIKKEKRICSHPNCSNVIKDPKAKSYCSQHCYHDHRKLQRVNPDHINCLYCGKKLNHVKKRKGNQNSTYFDKHMQFCDKKCMGKFIAGQLKEGTKVPFYNYASKPYKIEHYPNLSQFSPVDVIYD